MSNEQPDIHWPEWDPNKFKKEQFDRLLLWAKSIGANDVIFKTSEKVAVKKDGAILRVTATTLNLNVLRPILQEIRNKSVEANINSGHPLEAAYNVEGENKTSNRFRLCGTAVKGANASGSEIHLVCRVIPADPPTTDELGLPPTVVRGIDYDSGLFLIAGPTGSGKTTTCSSLIRKAVEETSKHIVTYEDPVEYDFSALDARTSLIAQSEVPTQIEGFVEAIKNAMRRAPDIIYLGELRSAETIMAAGQASASGHLMLSTLHANDCAAIIPRMVDLCPSSDRTAVRNLLINETRVLMNQILLPAVGGGRVAVREYIEFTDDIRRTLNRNVVGSGDDIGAAVRELVRSHGRSFLDDAKELHKQGVLNVDQLRRVATNSGDIEFVKRIDAGEI
ncbi:hypothetical protein A3709_19575 [Halioglobus sp. HI00S01]|uniref:type IV pilus twitching motility protein PilT n=1 Tax=Halioglobus sp. HI00S01 TaxID=1822214 RepID=UPI0007C37D7F|nr:ATPase, T2SS/T4P/T4SS family [Halioglobus sp. HI00S01]KZX57826.1 hypothetical protein A3709_19575 [Halioglobus sp. HI00S01]